MQAFWALACVFGAIRTIQLDVSLLSRSIPSLRCSGSSPPCTNTVDPTFSTVGCTARKRSEKGPCG